LRLRARRCAVELAECAIDACIDFMPLDGRFLRIRSRAASYQRAGQSDGGQRKKSNDGS
jgi:hypothetical protein